MKRVLILLAATAAVLFAAISLMPGEPAAQTGGTAPPSVGTSCTIEGTSGGDDLTGTSGAGVICGLGGPDSIEGGSGADELYGGRTLTPLSNLLVSAEGRMRRRAWPQHVCRKVQP